MQRLDEEQNEKFYTAALYDLHYLTVKCLSRVVIGAQSTTALKIYKNTMAGGNYAATIATHNMAWRKLCAVYGHNMPQTDTDRIEDILKLVEQYQGHKKTRKKYLQSLVSTGYSDTTVPYDMAEPIIGTAARAIDRLDALLGESKVKPVAVNTTRTGTGQQTAATGHSGGAVCKICAKPGHVARDCLSFMERKGVCKRWFMHGCLGKWGKGCEFENCRYKHERSDEEPEEEPVHVQCNAVGVTADPTEITVQDLQTLRMSGSTLPINNTNHWLNRSKFWMQPEDDSSLCTGCNTEHSVIQPCTGGGRHSMMPTEMQRDAEAIRCRWIPFSVQQAADRNTAVVSTMRATPTRTLVLATRSERKTAGVGFYDELGCESESDCD